MPQNLIASWTRFFFNTVCRCLATARPTSKKLTEFINILMLELFGFHYALQFSVYIYRKITHKLQCNDRT